MARAARGSRLRGQELIFAQRLVEIFREAREISVLCGTEIAVVVFHPSGLVFSFGSPDPADEIIPRLLPDLHSGEEDDGKDAAAAAAMEMKWTKEDDARFVALVEKLRPALAGKPWWEADIDKMGKAELLEFRWALERFREVVRRRIESETGVTLA